MPKINVSPRRFCVILFIFAVYFLLQSIGLRYIDDLYGKNTPFVLDKLARLFNSNVESSIPTYFSVLLLTFASVILAFITHFKYMNKEPYRFHWGLLTVIFLYLAIDESAEIHEIFTRPLREAFGLDGTLYFSWVLVGVIFVAVVGLIYLRFLWNLPRRTAMLMIVSGAIFVTGAIIIESISASIYDANDGSSVGYTAIGNFEEFLEMSGIILFIYTLLTYLGSITPHFQISFIGTSSDLEEDDLTP